MKQMLQKHGGKIIGFTFMLVIVVVAAHFVNSMNEDSPKKPKKQVQQISLVKPPPPPPPPPKQEKLPEPELEKEKVDIEEIPEEMPEVADDAPPAGDALGLDAEGGAGSDSFGLVGRKGGRGLLAGDPYAYFAGRLQDAIQDALAENKKVRSESYSIVVKVWVSPYGAVEQVKLARSTGNPSTDAAIREVLAGLTNMAYTPPEGMPQPVRLRITSRL
jgi:TonB family protein